MRPVFLAIGAMGAAALLSCGGCTTTTQNGVTTTTPPSPETLAAYEKFAVAAAGDGLTIASAVEALKSVPTPTPKK